MANPISELFKRRVPQIVGLYLVGCWGVVEFTDWAVEQYVLSPHVTNFVVILLVSLLPSVILLAWRFGAPGDDVWTRTESVVVPLNVIASAALLIFTFTGRTRPEPKSNERCPSRSFESASPCFRSTTRPPTRPSTG